MRDRRDFVIQRSRGLAQVLLVEFSIANGVPTPTYRIASIEEERASGRLHAVCGKHLARCRKARLSYRQYLGCLVSARVLGFGTILLFVSLLFSGIAVHFPTNMQNFVALGAVILFALFFIATVATELFGARLHWLESIARGPSDVS